MHSRYKIPSKSVKMFCDELVEELTDNYYGKFIVEDKPNSFIVYPLTGQFSFQSIDSFFIEINKENGNILFNHGYDDMKYHICMYDKFLRNIIQIITTLVRKVQIECFSMELAD